MAKDRFLTGILIGIGALVLAALVIFFVRRDNHTYRSENTPEAVTYNYVLATIQKDYQRAYSYLADLQYKPSYEDFRQSFLSGMVNPGNSGADIGQAEISGDQASVTLTIFYGYNDPFSGRSGVQERAILVNQGGVWRISSMPSGIFWGYEWYQKYSK